MVYVRALGAVGRAWVRHHADYRRADQARRATVPQPVAQQWAVPPTVAPRPVLRERLHRWAQGHAQAGVIDPDTLSEGTLAHAAAKALREAFGAAPDVLARGLAGWIEAHARIQSVLGGIRQWQWPFLLQC
eukprot:1377662-Lingulodinium_polyedra.AAC.1